MHALILNPSHESGARVPKKCRDMSYLPVSVAILNGELRRRGHTVTVINQYIEDVRAEDVDAVFVTAIDSKWSNLRREIPGLQRKAPVFIGGPLVHSYADADMGMADCGACFVSGGIESTLDDVLALLPAESGGLPARIHGAKVRRADEIATPDWSFVDPFIYDGWGTLRVEATRGCPNACTFCDVFYYHPRRLCRSLLSVVGDVKAIVDSVDFHRVQFADSNFQIGLEYGRSLIGQLRAAGLPVEWGASTDLLAVDDRLLGEAAAAGCVFLSVGIESLNRENLREVKKPFVPLDELKGLVSTCKLVGISFFANVIFGFDHDTPASIMETVERLVELRVDAAHFHVLDPTPGTPLYIRLHKAGRITGNCSIGPEETRFTPRHMAYDELLELTDRANCRFYSNESIMARCGDSRKDILELNHMFRANLSEDARSMW